MTDERWIVIRHWERFQHYADRDPTWIKVYTRLLHDDRWLGLTPLDRAALVGLWLHYASGDGHVTVDTRSLSRSLHQRITVKTLERLNEAGFIEFSASRPLALARSREGYRSKEITPKPPSTKRARKARVTGWRNVRGSHGQTTIADPNGTDPAPTIGRTL